MPEPKEESVADVLAEMRGGAPWPKVGRLDMVQLADRIQAAHAREIGEERAQGIGYCDEKDAEIARLKAAVQRAVEEMKNSEIDPSVRGTMNEAGIRFGNNPIYLMGTIAALEHWIALLEGEGK